MVPDQIEELSRAPDNEMSFYAAVNLVWYLRNTAPLDPAQCPALFHMDPVVLIGILGETEEQS